MLVTFYDTRVAFNQHFDGINCTHTTSPTLGPNNFPTENLSQSPTIARISNKSPNGNSNSSIIIAVLITIVTFLCCVIIVIFIFGVIYFVKNEGTKKKVPVQEQLIRSLTDSKDVELVRAHALTVQRATTTESKVIKFK